MGSAASASDRVAGAIARFGLDSTPGALAARSSGGFTVLRHYGEPEIDGPVTTTTVWYAASVAKQVIGLLLSQQVQAGVVDPDEPLGQYIDDLPGWRDRITTSHLVHHTSGLPPLPNREARFDNGEMLDLLRRYDQLATEPGTAFLYSNTGYLCLAEVLTRTTGRTIEALAQSSLFGPLGMNSTMLGRRTAAVRAGHARPPATAGDGGLWTTAEDLLRWNDGMNSQAFGSVVHERAETTGFLADGTALDYAWGVRVFDHHGQRTLSHGGSWPSWSAKTVRQPDQGISIAILTSGEDAEAITAAALAAIDVLR